MSYAYFEALYYILLIFINAKILSKYINYQEENLIFVYF